MMQKIAPLINQSSILISLKEIYWDIILATLPKLSRFDFNPKLLAELSTLETKQQRKKENPVQMYISMIFNA